MINSEIIEPDAQQVVTYLANILSNIKLSESHAYLQQCERDPSFVRMLFNIFEKLEPGDVRDAVYLYCVNVIKRNIHANRKAHGLVNLDQQKPFIRQTIIRYCTKRPGLKWTYLRDLLKYVAYIEYPSNWSQLQQLMVTNLQSLYETSLIDERKIEDIDLIRVVVKGEGRRSSFMKKGNVFLEYTIHITRPAEAISTIFDRKLSSGDIPSELELKLSSILDRIILSCLNTINDTLLNDPELPKVIGRLMSKIAIYISMLDKSPNLQYSMLVIKCIKRVVIYMGVLQASFPLLFSQMLIGYLNLLVNLIKLSPQLRKVDQQQLVCKAAMIGLIRVLRTFAYYADETTFASSLMNRSPKLLPVRENCRRQFLEFFTPQMIENIINSIISNILSFRSEEVEEELQEQSSQGMIQMENSPASIGSNLLSHLMGKFKAVCAQIIGTILNALITNSFNVNAQLQSNTYFMLLILPSVYEQTELPIDRILVVMAHLHSVRQFNRHFALMVSKYYVMLTDEQLQQAFDCLIEITVNHTDSIAIFQSTKSISLILGNKQGSVNIAGLPKTVLVVVRMLSKFKNPSALRHLLKVTNNILTNVQFDSHIVAACVESPAVHQLLRTHDEPLVYSLCEFLESLLSKTDRKQLTELAIVFADANMDKTLDNPEVIYHLWVVTIRNYQPGNNLQPILKVLYDKHIESVKQESPKIFCELLQEYLLLGLIDFSQIVSYVMELLQCGLQTHTPRGACWSLYLYSLLLQPLAVCPADIIRLMFETLRSIEGHSSAQNNDLQNTLINIINLLICRNPVEFNGFVCQVLSTSDAEWIEVWLRHSRLLYTYESEKLNTIAILYMLERMTADNVLKRFESLMRAAMINLDPQDVSSSLVKKGKSSRKREVFRRQLSIMNLDVKPLFKEKIIHFFNRLGISEDFIKNSIKSHQTIQKLRQLLS